MIYITINFTLLLAEIYSHCQLNFFSSRMKYIVSCLSIRIVVQIVEIVELFLDIAYKIYRIYLHYYKISLKYIASIMMKDKYNAKPAVYSIIISSISRFS